MGTSLKIMDLELDLLTEETFCKKMAEYLSGDLFRVVHLVSLIILINMKKSQSFRKY